jgi:hypothetical protein
MVDQIAVAMCYLNSYECEGELPEEDNSESKSLDSHHTARYSPPH